MPAGTILEVQPIFGGKGVDSPAEMKKYAKLREEYLYGDKSSEDKNPHTPMLSSDCLNVELFNVDQNIDFTPDLTLDQIDFSWANLTALYNLHPQMTRLIRGPPISVASSHFNNIDLYLSTQRLRI